MEPKMASGLAIPGENIGIERVGNKTLVTKQRLWVCRVEELQYTIVNGIWQLLSLSVDET